MFRRAFPAVGVWRPGPAEKASEQAILDTVMLGEMTRQARHDGLPDGIATPPKPSETVHCGGRQSVCAFVASLDNAATDGRTATPRLWKTKPRPGTRHPSLELLLSLRYSVAFNECSIWEESWRAALLSSRILSVEGLVRTSGSWNSSMYSSSP